MADKQIKLGVIGIGVGAAEMLRAVSGPGGHRFYPDQAWPAFLEMTRAK